MEVISRKDALALGLKSYFTGKPCKHGHVSERQSTNGNCLECLKIKKEQNPEYYREIKRKSAEAHKEANKARLQDYYNNNKEKVKKRASDWKKSNKERSRENNRKWYRNNKTKALESARGYFFKNKASVYSKAAIRRAEKRRAKPSWLSAEDIRNMRAVYEMASRLSSCLGVKHDVDHIIPLVSPVVCGLHVPWNLSAIPSSVNRSKSNKLLLEEPS